MMPIICPMLGDGKPSYQMDGNVSQSSKKRKPKKPILRSKRTRFQKRVRFRKSVSDATITSLKAAKEAQEARRRERQEEIMRKRAAEAEPASHITN